MKSPAADAEQPADDKPKRKRAKKTTEKAADAAEKAPSQPKPAKEEKPACLI